MPDTQIQERDTWGGAFRAIAHLGVIFVFVRVRMALYAYDIVHCRMCVK